MGIKTEISLKNLIFKVTFLLFVLLGLSMDMFAQNVQLFNHIDAPQSEWAGKQVADLRQIEIQVHEPVLKQIRDGQITEFSIMGFNGIEYTIEARRIIEQLDGDWSVIGWINGNLEDSFILSYSNDEVLSTIREVTNHNFMEIRFDNELNNHLLIEIDPHERDELECGQDHELVAPDNESQNLREENFDPSFNNLTIIDVMVVYTASAESWASSGSGGIRNVINQAMAIAQNSADNSRLNLQFRLVYTARVNYSETGNSRTDLNNLTFGSIPNVQSLRDQYGADLVAMFTSTNDVGGVGWLLNNTSGSPAYGYSITRVQQASWTSTHAHEIGHNMGNHHSRNQNMNPAPLSGGLYNYSTGWRWTGTNNRSYASVMTYGEGSTMVDIFSNPDVSWQGAPSGSYTGGYAPADNARSMRQIMGVIANYRPNRIFTTPPTVSTNSISDISFTTARSGGNVTDDGGSSVTSRGICWSTQPNPGLSNSCRSSGSGTGSYSITMENLETNTSYYIRAFATNSEGTAYGNQRSFTTLQIMVDASQSSINSSRIKVQANSQNSSTITVIARDRNGIRLGGFSTRLITKRGTLQSSPANLNTNSNGEAEFIVTNSKVEQVEYGAISGGIELATTVVVSYIGIDAQLSNIETSSGKVQADGDATAEITVYAKDEDGTAFSNLEVELIPDRGSSHIEVVQGTTDNNGIAIFKVSNLIAERVRYSARGLGTTISNQAEINFVTVDPARSSVLANTDRVVANGMDTVTITVFARDEDDDPIQGVLIQLTDNDSGAKIEPSEQRTDAAGEASYHITSNNMGIIDFIATAIRPGGNVEFNQKASVAFIPVAPVSLSATNIETRRFTSNWELVPGTDAYRLDVATDSTFTSYLSGFNDHDAGNVTFYTITTASPGTDYFYRIRAALGSLIGADSQIIGTTTYPDTPLASEATQRNALAFTANWQLAEGARNYLIDVSRDLNFTNILSLYHNLHTGNAQQISIDGLEPGMEYYYRVRSEAGPRTSDHSNTIFTTTLAINAENSIIAQAQRRILANGTQTNQIEVHVKSDEGISLKGLSVNLIPDSGDSQIRIVRGETDIEGIAYFELSNYNAETINYTVLAHDIEIGTFEVEYLSDDGILSLGDNYPNPFMNNTILPITVNAPMNVEIRIYDVSGKPVQTVFNERVDAGYYEIPFKGYGLAAGVYFYRMFTDKKIFTERMVMVR